MEKKKLGGGGGADAVSLSGDGSLQASRRLRRDSSLKKGKTIKNSIDIDLYNCMNEESQQGKPIQIRRMKVASKTARILFNELVNELGQ
jgi:hypothetical protein